jgi:hypothetical protein
VSDTRRKPGRPRSLTAEGEAEARRLHTLGFTLAQVAAAVGASKSVVGRLLRRAPRKKPADLPALAQAYAAHGHRYWRAAEASGYSVSTVGRAVRKYGQPSHLGRPGPDDPRRGRGKKGPQWMGEDYDEEVALGILGQRGWRAWTAHLPPKEHTAIESAVHERIETLSPEKLAVVRSEMVEASWEPPPTPNDGRPREVAFSDLSKRDHAYVDTVLYGEPQDEADDDVCRRVPAFFDPFNPDPPTTIADLWTYVTTSDEGEDGET